MIAELDDIGLAWDEDGAGAVVGSTMGTRPELKALTDLLDVSGVRPVIDQVLPMEQAAEGFAAMHSGDVFGKVVFTR